MRIILVALSLEITVAPALGTWPGYVNCTCGLWGGGALWYKKVNRSGIMPDQDPNFPLLMVHIQSMYSVSPWVLIALE